MTTIDLKQQWREQRLLRERRDHEPAPQWEDTPRKPLNRRVCNRKGCEETAERNGLCPEHRREYARQRYAEQQAELEAIQERRKQQATYEPVRYALIPEPPADPELAAARRRFPLVPQMSDEELLAFHRAHPRELEAGK